VESKPRKKATRYFFKRYSKLLLLFGGREELQKGQYAGRQAGRQAGGIGRQYWQ